MNIQFRHRCLSMVLVLVMLFTMTPVSVIAEEEHDHSHESTETSVVIGDEAVTVLATEELAVSASASANHVYVGDGAVTVTAKISGGMAPYEVQLQAVKNGDVVATDSVTTEAASAKLTFTPASYGDYELVVVVHDALHTQELVSISLAAAEHDEESEQEWAASVSGASVSSDWAKSLVSVAKTQVGYTESAKDFVIKNGAKEGYSRYGAWFGTPYGGWNTAFLAFVAEYANIPTDAFLSGSSYRSWVNGMSAKGAYEQAGSGYAPKAGDIAFLSGSRVAIIESVSGTNLTVIEGDVDGAVVRKTYALSKVAGIGNTQLLMGLYNGTATAVPAVTPEPTKAPEGSEPVATATPVPTAAPTATPVPEDDEELTFQATPTPGPGVTVAPKEDDDILGSMVNQMGDAVEQMQAAATSVPTQFSEAYYLMQDEMTKLAAKYLGEGEKTPAEIKAFVDGLELGDLYYIVMELDELEDYAKNIGFTEYEGYALNESEEMSATFVAAVKERWSLMTEDRAATGTYTPVEGVTVDVSGATDNSMVDGAVTVTAKGSAGLWGIGASSKTATITMTNSSETTATISFDWTASSVNELKIDSSVQSDTSGSFSKVLAANASVTIQITTGKNGTTNKLVMSNFGYVAAASSVNVVFEYHSALGSITVGGAALDSGSTYELDTTTGAEVVATPASGSTFLSWINAETGEILSTGASFTLTLVADASVKAVFINAGSAPYFGVGGLSGQQTYKEGFLGLTYYYNSVNLTYIFDNLKDACQTASESDSKYIVLLNSGTLPVDTYTIPSGVTLLIPFDTNNTLYTTTPVVTGNWATPYAYRTLTMASGTELIVEGAVSLSAKHQYASGSGFGHGGCTNGAYGHIQMADGSKITVNEGGALYAYGYITGSGSVTANSGSSVYEYFQIMDFRGGSASTSMQHGVFPLSQYYVQNIEVPLTLYAGAKENSFTSIYMSSSALYSSVAFISDNNAMFKLTSGYVVKDYDENTDRLIIDSHGDLTVSPIDMQVSISSINSKNYQLPINSNITVTAHSGKITMNQNLALLPGAEIIVKKDAECTLAQGYNIFVYDVEVWKTYCFQAGNGGAGDKKLIPAVYAPGRKATRTEVNLVDAKMIIEGTTIANGGIYTTTGGADISGVEGAIVKLSKPGTLENTYQYRQTAGAYDAIGVTSAKLKNADGTFALTENASNAMTYTYTDGRWTCVVDTAAGLNHAFDKEYECCDRTCMVCGYYVPHTVEHIYDRAPACVPNYCKDCGEGEIAATAEHAFGEWAVKQQPTCTEKGVSIRVCTNECGTEETKEIDANGHVWSDWYDRVAPTCTEAGSKTRACTVDECGETETNTTEDDVKALGHDMAAATCEAPATCKREGCETTEGEPLGHKYVSTVTKEANCGVPGNTYYKCENNGEHFYNEPIPATGEHTWDEGIYATQEDEPDCINAGKKTFTCTVCASKMTETVDALGHNMTTVPGKDATCTENGLTEGKKCARCGYWDLEQKIITASGHKETEEITTPAGCLTDGVKTFTCSACGATRTETIGAAGHDYQEETVSATCEQDGYTQKKCSGCGDIIEKKTLTALGHDYESEVTRAPGCETEGEKTYTCQNNPEHTYKETIESTDHDWDEGVVSLEPGCETEGVRTYTCKNDPSHTKKEKIDATDHSWSETVEPVTDPTCTTDGLGTQDCANCEEKKEVVIPATGHTFDMDAEFVEPTCMTPGHGAGKNMICSVCGAFHKDLMIIVDPEAHDFVAKSNGDDTHTEVCTWNEEHIGITRACSGGTATCVAKATCGGCGEAWGELKAHEPKFVDNGDGITHASVCKNCETPIKDAAPHTMGDYTNDGTQHTRVCIGCGYEETGKCSGGAASCVAKAICDICGKEHGEYATHTPADEWTSNGDGTHSKYCTVDSCVEACETANCDGEATCIEKAQCTVCGGEYGELAAHTLADEWTSNGNGKHNKHCVVVGCVYETALVDCSGGTATCQKKAACKDCGAEYGEKNPDNHEWASGTRQEPTCEEWGYQTANVCPCGAMNEKVDLEPLGHAWGDWKSDGNGKHSRVCSRDNNHVDTKECAGGEATCTHLAVCTDCKTEYGQLSDKHDYSVCVPNDNGTHTYVCSFSNEHKGETEACSGGTATCIAYAVCATCKEEYGELAEHTPAEKWQSTGNGQHNKACIVEGCTYETEPVPCTGGTATCTEKAKCDVCGSGYGALKAHSYGEWYVTKEAECNIRGEERRDCEDCDAFETQATSALKHSYTSIDEIPKTCTEDGWTAGVWCPQCETYFTKPEKIPAGHTLNDVAAQAPTCTEAGWEAYQKCSECDYSTKVEIAASHTLKEVAAKAATCKEVGWNAYQQCSKCDYNTKVEIGLLNHIEEVVPGKAASCTETGLTEGKKCSVCGDTLLAQTVIPVVDHTEEVVPGKAATCTSTGLTDGAKCSVCGATITPQTVIAASGHNEEVVLGKAATCTENGLTDGKKCSVCHETLTEQTVILSRGGHAVVTEKGTAATCTIDGVTDYKYCSVCSEVLAEKTVIKAKGHTEATDEAKAPTCTETGLTEGKHCSVCNEILAEQTKVDALGHTVVVDNKVDATCTQDGLTEGRHCSVCGDILVAQETISATGHIPAIDAYKAPTCTETGLTEGSHCSVCNEVLTAQETIPALEHKYVGTQTKDPTCTEDGVKTYICENDEKHTYDEPIPALGHDYVNHEAKKENCTEIGWEAYETCSRCDYSTYVEIPALGHKLDEGTVLKEFSCDVAGEVLYTCQNEACDYTKIEVIEAHHMPEVIPAVAPTCTTTGLTEGSQCSVCGDILVKPEIVEASHNWETVKVITEATCIMAGQRDVRCTVEGCGATDTIEIPAKGHTVVIDPAVAATCETDGATEGKHCSVCEAVLVAQNVIPAAHKWNAAPCTSLDAKCTVCGLTNDSLLEHAWSEATCSAPATCQYCKRTRGSTLPHTEVEDEEVPAMCEEPGLTVGKHCSVCGYVISAQSEIPALGHDMVSYEAKNPTFTTDGWKAYEGCVRCAHTIPEKEDYILPALGVQTIESYSEFMKYLPWLEKWAVEYAKVNPATDPVDLVIKYIRTGVDRYNSGSWGIMAGYENPDFAKYVNEQEDKENQQYDNIEDMIKVSGLKNIENFKLPNGDLTDIGHMFGTMDITYNNDCGVNHADVGGWAGDLVDLLSTADHTDHAEDIASANGDFEALVDVIRYKLLGKSFSHSDVFSDTDIYGDLDGFYVMKNLDFENYQAGDMTALFNSYFTTSLNDVDRAAYLLEHRLNGVATRSAVRDAVYTAYTSNNVISTLEATRDFNSSDLTVLRQAVCYAFADYLCELAGDYVDVTDNPYLAVFQSEHANLAPGISMEIHYANSADGKQMVYYLAYAAVGRDDVTVLANYNERYVTHWEMSRVLDQANTTQALYGDPESEQYIENFNVITAINGSGFNMSTGEPSGLLIMHGDQYHPIDGNGFFGMHKDGYAVIGTTEEYNTKYKGQIEEAIAGFGTMLVKDGELAITATSNYYTDRASRTAVGITATGRVVFMVLDGRQEPWSCGGSMIEIAQIMKNAGCVQAINLDGGGSTTFVARQAGDEDLSVVNRPSDGVSRSVSTGLVMVSTAPSSTAFDHAVVESNYNNLTIGSTVQMTAKGVSATGNVVDLPEGAFWAVSDETVGTIDENGVFTALELGSVEIRLMLDDAVLGYKTLNVVVPDQLYFTKDKMDGVYGASITLPLKARYEGKEVAFNANDVVFSLSNATVGTMEGLNFKAVEASTITNVTITAALAGNDAVNAKISVVLFKQGENSFDFDQATGGSRILAWQRTISNSTTADNSVYYIVNPEEDMVTSYTIALDMTQIPIPQRLDDLIYMLPGADMEGASAWTFLLQLAERISVLTTVKPQIKIDPNFDVDYSELKLINDYFVLNGTEFDEATNTLTLTLNWIDQTAPIPVDTANPLCMVTGLKLIPKKDAAWNDKDQLKPVHQGTVSYDIYMRASGLYSFAQKEENQKVFGLRPFVNPNDESEKGGYFQDTYTEFTDTYTLVRSLKNGWYTEDTGFRYYVNGQYHTGVMEADGLYYDFGADGINVGKKTYTGLHVMNGNTYYIQAGEIATGWNIIGNDWYLFDYVSGIGINGKRVSGGIEYEFENGRLLHGVWVKDNTGYKYYYGPGNYYSGWKIIDGEEYFFVKNYALTGIVPVQEAHDLIHYWYEFTDTGIKIGLAKDGLHWYQGELYYVVGGLADRLGLYYIDDQYYNFTYSDYAVRNQTFWVYETNGLDMPQGMYRFDNEGRMIMTTEIVEEDGVLYYYENGPRIDQKGMVEFKGNLYYIAGGGAAVVDKMYWVSKPNGLVSKAGMYLFDENGHLNRVTSIVEGDDGKLYYFKDGLLTYSAGLVQVEGAYYYIDKEGTAVTDTTMWVDKTNNLMKKGDYTFGADGKMIIKLLGDANNDNTVSLEDAVLVFKYAANPEVEINLVNADVNGDKVVDAKDALLIMQYDAGWDVEFK